MTDCTVSYSGWRRTKTVNSALYALVPYITITSTVELALTLTMLVLSPKFILKSNNCEVSIKAQKPRDTNIKTKHSAKRPKSNNEEDTTIDSGKTYLTTQLRLAETLDH